MYEYNAKVTRVIDGDTLEAEVDLGFYMFARIRFRLAGIDTPEIHGVKKDSEEYKRGQESKAEVERLLALVDNKVRLKTEKTGKYGRWLAWVFPRNDDPETCTGAPLNDILVAKGLAKRYDGGAR